jgi:hypothetical protein
MTQSLSSAVILGFAPMPHFLRSPKVMRMIIDVWMQHPTPRHLAHAHDPGELLAAVDDTYQRSAALLQANFINSQ